MTMTAPRRAMCAGGPGLAASSAAVRFVLTNAPFDGCSCDVAAEGGDPAEDGGDGCVGDQQQRGGEDGELVFVAGEGEAGAAGHQLRGARDEALGDAFDEEHPGAEADQGANLVADERADSDAQGGPECCGGRAAGEDARVVAAGELVGDAADREGDRGGGCHQALGEQAVDEPDQGADGELCRHHRVAAGGDEGGGGGGAGADLGGGWG